jgi:hypothetical protein
VFFLKRLPITPHLYTDIVQGISMNKRFLLRAFSQVLCRKVLKSTILIGLLLGCILGEVVGQAVPGNSPTFPRHETLDQRVVSEFFSQPLSGSTTTGQWIVRINGSSAGIIVTGVSISPTGPFGASASPTANNVHIQFNASGAAGHTAATPYVLPGETLTIQYTGNTLTTGTAPCLGCPVAVFGPFTSKNNYAPTCNSVTGDVKFASNGVASILDQCAPVNADYWRWTYQYTLRYRNSSTWVTTNNRVSVAWNAPGGTSTINGYLSDNSGTPNATNAAIVNTWDAFSNPSVFLTFRPGFNATTLTLDGTNGAFSYPDNGICNYGTTVFPVGVATAVYNCSGGGPTLQIQNQFNSFSNDNQGGVTGNLIMNPTVPPVTPTNDLVCIGTNVGMRFTDATIFNCVGNSVILPTPPNAFQLPLNNQQRHIRFIYGGIDSPSPQGNIRDIRVGGTYGVNNGVQVTDAVTGALVPGLNPNPILAPTYPLPLPGPNPEPTLRGYVPTGAGGIGNPDAKGVIQLPANITVTNALQTALITTLTCQSCDWAKILCYPSILGCV